MGGSRRQEEGRHCAGLLPRLCALAFKRAAGFYSVERLVLPPLEAVNSKVRPFFKYCVLSPLLAFE